MFKRRLRNGRAAKLSGWLIAFFTVCSSATADVTIEVRDPLGQPIEHAVIIVPNSKNQSPPSSPLPVAVMDQIHMQFNPHVLIAAQGQEVIFPNSDDIRHHVYSFSEAKSFEIKLYKGVHGTKLNMEKPGVVELGCNIHDSMLGFIYVDDTGTAVKTDAKGQATLNTLVAGEIEVWHPRLSLGKKKAKFDIVNTQDNLVQITLEIQPKPTEELKNTFKRGFNRKYSAKGERE